MDITKYICKTAGCPQFGDWAILNKFNVKWGNHKRGDIVLFDFNNNGTSDHIGIVTKVGSGYIETIEGNTGNGSNTNGDGVYRRKRYKSQVNYFVRPKMPEEYRELIIKTAEAELGYKEGKNNSNKYGKAFGYNNVSWCCIFVWWLFKNCKSSSTKPSSEKPKLKEVYTGELPDFVKLSGTIISDLAKSCAHPKGTAKAKRNYATGKPYGKFKEMLNKAFPNRSGWGKLTKAGASCDVFVGTIVRCSGMDSEYPRGIEGGQIKYYTKNFDVLSDMSLGKLRAGDVVRFLRKGGGGHTLVLVDVGGVLYKCEASYSSKGGAYALYGYISGKASGYKASSYKKCEVIRCNHAIRAYLKEGDKNDEVKKLQKFLNWYGGYNLAVDGDFGRKTLAAVREFQLREKLTVDGLFGNQCVKKAKEVVR